MLHIYVVGADEALPEDGIHYISDWFDGSFEEHWFKHDFVRELVKALNNATYLEGCIFDSEYGGTPPHYLSVSVKALILAMQGVYIDGDMLDDNCLPYLLRLAQQQDIRVFTTHIFNFDCDFDAVIDNDGSLIHTRAEFRDKVVIYRD